MHIRCPRNSSCCPGTVSACCPCPQLHSSEAAPTGSSELLPCNSLATSSSVPAQLTKCPSSPRKLHEQHRRRSGHCRWPCRVHPHDVHHRQRRTAYDRQVAAAGMAVVLHTHSLRKHHTCAAEALAEAPPSYGPVYLVAPDGNCQSVFCDICDVWIMPSGHHSPLPNRSWSADLETLCCFPAAYGTPADTHALVSRSSLPHATNSVFWIMPATVLDSGANADQVRFTVPTRSPTAELLTCA